MNECTAMEHFRNGKRAVRLGIFKETLFDYNVMALNEDCFHTLKLAFFLYGSEEFQAASLHFDEFLRRNPKDALALWGKGGSQAGLRQFEIGIQLCQQALQIEPQLAHAYSDMAYCLNSLGRVTESLQCLYTSVRLGPNYATCQHNLGAVLNNIGRHREALEFFQKAIEIDPTEKFALCSKGWCHYLLQQYQQSQECFDKSVEIDARSSLKFFDQLYQSTRQVTTYRAALFIAIQRKAQCHMRLEQYEQAIENYQMYVQLDSEAKQEVHFLIDELSDRLRINRARVIYATKIVHKAFIEVMWRPGGNGYKSALFHFEQLSHFHLTENQVTI